MIFLMSIKQWDKDKKKLVRPKDYIICDATEDDDAKMNSYNNCVTLDSINPPAKLVKLASKNNIGGMDDIIDYDKIQKLEKEFFKGIQLRKAMLAVVAAGIEHDTDVNIFIVMRNKAFKLYKKKMKKAFTKLFDVDFDFITIYSGDLSEHKSELKRSFKDNEISKLRKVLKKRETEAAEEFKKKSKKKKKW